MKNPRTLTLFGLLVAPFACQVDAGDPAPATLRSADLAPAPPTSTYYIVTAIDYRKCMFPLCGGVFVKEVNQALSLCADGSYAEECHVAVTDYAALGLAPSTEQKLDGVWQESGALLRGKLTQGGSPKDPYPTNTLIASEAWVAVTGQKPDGVFERLDDSGIVCVSDPCNSFIERILNDGFTRLIAEVDLAASGATPEQVAAGTAELYATGILAVGNETVVEGPAGTAPGFAATEFYTRLVADPYVGEQCGAVTCGEGFTCCNASCGVCTLPEDSCLAVVCDPLE